MNSTATKDFKTMPATTAAALDSDDFIEVDLPEDEEEILDHKETRPATLKLLIQYCLNANNQNTSAMSPTADDNKAAFGLTDQQRQLGPSAFNLILTHLKKECELVKEWKVIDREKYFIVDNGIQRFVIFNVVKDFDVVKTDDEPPFSNQLRLKTALDIYQKHSSDAKPHDIILAPLIQTDRGHLVLALCDLQDKLIHFLDSQGTKAFFYSYFQSFSFARISKLAEELGLSYNWKEHYHYFFAQEKAYECGYYVYLYIRHLIFNSYPELQKIKFIDNEKITLSLNANVNPLPDISKFIDKTHEASKAKSPTPPAPTSTATASQPSASPK